MKYLIEPIGAQFSDKDLPKLAARFDSRSKEGYQFHSVFEVTQPGCLGVGQGTSTYVAVYVRDDTARQ